MIDAMITSVVKMVMAGKKKKKNHFNTISEAWQTQGEVSDGFSLLRYVFAFSNCKPGHDGTLLYKSTKVNEFQHTGAWKKHQIAIVLLYFWNATSFSSTVVTYLCAALLWDIADYHTDHSLWFILLCFVHFDFFKDIYTPTKFFRIPWMERPHPKCTCSVPAA